MQWSQTEVSSSLSSFAFKDDTDTDEINETAETTNEEDDQEVRISP